MVATVREQAQKIETLQKQRSLSIEKDKPDDQCYVRNSSFLSRDIEAQKGKETPPKTTSPPIKVMSPPKKQSPKTEPTPAVVSPPKNVKSAFKLTRTDSKVEENSVAIKAIKIEAASPPKKEVNILPKKEITPPPRKEVVSPPRKEVVSPPRKEVTSPPRADVASPPKKEITLPPKKDISPPTRKEVASPPKKEVTSPPVSAFKINRSDSKPEEITSVAAKVAMRENSVGKEVSAKADKLSTAGNDTAGNSKTTLIVKVEEGDKTKNENGVGDKIKKFEKAAEDASSTLGRLSRHDSVRGRSRTERIGSDSNDEFPPPATPFKDNVHFDLSNADKSEHYPVDRQQSLSKGSSPNPAAAKWQKSDSHEDKIQKPEPQKIIKPEFKPMPSPVDVTIRSPSLGAKIADQFPSHGTAFRNVGSPDQARTNLHKFNDDVNTQNNYKTCKLKGKKEYSVSKGSSYFTRGSEEIWLVKKKDIEEIEERVLDSFRRAGGNVCMRSESMRPSSDSGQGGSFTHATMGRNKRQMYARSESLDPQWAGARAQTLKRQTSVACTCGHDKKTRAKSAGADAAPRPRSRSHGDDNNQAHVLDKYETLV